MSYQTQRSQVAKLVRAFACAGVIIGPYIYTMARPEKTLKYRFQPATNENGESTKVDSSYNRLATEVNIFSRYVISSRLFFLDRLSHAIT